ncbi:hypothetical protein SCLCIDRAFT_22891 [Scleroderma citrinum Foug A]|uniref:DUF6830 domain-containing protein n=1 Tax=Scleroderma citrinum Foug A TaxID=1036808 RepID=A0A0C3DWX7_9AGAM|nr:hypothetical protein SCLCIDRAFT_22891 [Scleroderma citrinum Foug A]
MYQTQGPFKYTDTSIVETESSLHEFHAHKDAIIEAGVRQSKAAGTQAYFYIPELELFHSFTMAVHNSGALILHTADVSEHLLITYCQHAFKCTSNNEDFPEWQVVEFLDCQEGIWQFNMYTLLRSSDVLLTINNICVEEKKMSITDPTLAPHILLDEQWQIQGPRPVYNHFAAGISASNNVKAALHITYCPDKTNLSLNDIAMQYRLPDFEAHYMEFLWLHSHDTHLPLGFNRITLWYKFHVRLQSTFCSSNVLLSQDVQARPPSQDFLFRCCNTVSISPPNNVEGYVVQVRAIFQPHTPSRSKLQAPPYLDKPLIYIQPFHVVATPDQQPELRMWTVERTILHAEGGKTTREGLIIPIGWVLHAVELIPVFGSENVSATVTSATSQESYDHFFINHFTDKEIYNTLHGPIGRVGVEDTDDDSN